MVKPKLDWAFGKCFFWSFRNRFYFYFTDASKVEVELKSDVNSEILEILPYTDKLKKYGKDVLDMRVGEADMTVSEIFKSFVEVQLFDFTIILTDRLFFIGKNIKHTLLIF